MANKGLTLPAEVFNKCEIGRFLRTFKESWTGRRNRCMFLLALRCQLRSHEIVSLRVSDVDFDRGCITVLNGKGKKRRVVGCDEDTLGEVRAYLEMRSLEHLHLFPSHRGRELSTSYLRKLSARHGKKAGLNKRCHMHSHRHSGAVMLAEAGVPINVIRRQLGHSSLSVTQRYIDHLSGNDVVRAVREVQW
jgi:integrase/recombinase XerD